MPSYLAAVVPFVDTSTTPANIGTASAGSGVRPPAENHVHNIPAGYVTTAMLAAGAVSQSGSSNWSGTTTSTTYVDITGSSVALTTTGGSVYSWFAFSGYEDTPSVFIQFTGVQDGSAQGINPVVAEFGANQYMALSWPLALTPSVGAHTYKAQWLVQAGTGTVYTGTTVCVEIKK